jgi:hypothetical protein
MIVLEETETGLLDRFFGALIVFLFTTITIFGTLYFIFAKFFAVASL